MYINYLDLIAQFAAGPEATLEFPLGPIVVTVSEDPSEWILSFCLGKQALPRRFFRWQKESIELIFSDDSVYLQLTTSPLKGYVSFKTVIEQFLQEITFWHGTMQEIDSIAFC